MRTKVLEVFEAKIESFDDEMVYLEVFNKEEKFFIDAPIDLFSTKRLKEGSFVTFTFTEKSTTISYISKRKIPKKKVKRMFKQAKRFYEKLKWTEEREN